MAMNKTDRAVKKAESAILKQISDYDQAKIDIAKATTIIHQIAWLVVKIADLQRTIDDEGMVEEYSNGAEQAGRKVSSNVQVLNGFQKTYTSMVSKFFDLIKNAGEKKVNNPLADFQAMYENNAGMAKRKLP